MSDRKDVFFCYASEDKDLVVKPLVEACEQAGISCWFDEAAIQWGDSIAEKVNEGLAKSKFVVVVFSISFLEKSWPKRELNAVSNLEASLGNVKILPLIVGQESERKAIYQEFPLLNDKKYLSWDGNLKKIVTTLLSRLNSCGEKTIKRIPSAVSGPDSQIPFPKLRKNFTQRDKDQFLHGSFTVVVQYFQKALKDVEGNYQEVDTDFQKIHEKKFIATIYLNGEIANRCKIWIDGMTASDSIAYQTGSFGINADNSFNEMLSVVDDGEVIGFRSLLSSYSSEDAKPLSAELAAENLWREFTQTMGQGRFE